MRKFIGKRQLRAVRDLAVLARHVDRRFYYETYPGVAASRLPAFWHYWRHGAAEGRDPTPDFSTNRYIAENPAVASTGLNPFVHYIVFGRAEGRLAPKPRGASLPKVKPKPPEFPGRDRLDGALASKLANLHAWSPLVHADGADAEAADDTPAPPTDVAARLAEHPDATILSLDVWDTLLRRDCAPDEIKLRLARRLWLRLGGKRRRLHPLDIFMARKTIEDHVADDDFEYRFGDAMLFLTRALGLDIGPQALEAEEMAIEARAVRADDIVPSLVSADPRRKIVLSDFYHRGEALAGLLETVLPDLEPATVLTSSDVMKTKRAGTLYPAALEATGHAPEAVVHIGDNERADVGAARAAGLNAILYENPAEAARAKTFDTRFRDYLAGDLSGHERALLEIADASDVPGSRLALALLGLALEVAETAIAKKSRDVFFFTREGHLFRRVYEAVAAADVYDLGADYPEPRTLFVSRNSTFAASLDSVSASSLMRLWSQYSSQSMTMLARSLNIDPVRWTKALARAGLSADEVLTFPWEDARVRAFLRDPEIVAGLAEHVSRERRALIEYLDAAGFEPGRARDRVVVDIGWRGSTQDNLSRAVPGTTTGVYLGTIAPLNDPEPGVSKTGYLFDHARGDEMALPDAAALEFFFNGPGGSAAGYENGEPLLTRRDVEETFLESRVSPLHDGWVALASDLAAYVRDHGLVASDLRAVSRDIVARHAAAPEPALADIFIDGTHEEDFGVATSYASDAMASAVAEAVETRDGAEAHDGANRALSQLRWRASLAGSTRMNELRRRLSPAELLHLPSALAVPPTIRLRDVDDRRILVFCPTPILGSGGHRTIFNYCRGLQAAGFQVDLMLEEPPRNPRVGQWIARQLEGHGIAIEYKWRAGQKACATVATIDYSTLYQATWYDERPKLYFVQDFEAQFNPVSDAYLRGERSYALPDAAICIANWLPHLIATRYGTPAVGCGFGVDTSVYHPLPDAERGTKVAFLYQPEKFRRAPHLCIDALRIAGERLPALEVVTYGSDARHAFPFAVDNRGLVTDLDKLNAIYNECAVGLCLSATNPSRIPFEMMAAGCVPVDLYRENNLFDADENAAILAYQSPESLAEAIIRVVSDKDRLAAMSRSAISRMAARSLDWETDMAVNATVMALEGPGLAEIPPPAATYLAPPVIAEADDTPAVRAFLDWQRRSAGISDAQAEPGPSRQKVG